MIRRHSQRIRPPERPVTSFGEKLKEAFEHKEPDAPQHQEADR